MRHYKVYVAIIVAAVVGIAAMAFGSWYSRRQSCDELARIYHDVQGHGYYETKEYLRTAGCDVIEDTIDPGVPQTPDPCGSGWMEVCYDRRHIGHVPEWHPCSVRADCKRNRCECVPN